MSADSLYRDNYLPNVGCYLISILSIEGNPKLYSQFESIFLAITALNKEKDDEIASLYSYRLDQIDYRRRLMRYSESALVDAPAVSGLTPGISRSMAKQEDFFRFRNPYSHWQSIHGDIWQKRQSTLYSLYAMCREIMEKEIVVIEKRQNITDLEAWIATHDDINQLLTVDFANMALNNPTNNERGMIAGHGVRSGNVNMNRGGRLSDNVIDHTFDGFLELRNRCEEPRDSEGSYDIPSDRILSDRYRLVVACHEGFLDINLEYIKIFVQLLQNLSDHRSFRDKVNKCLDGISNGLKDWDETRSDLSGVGRQPFPEEYVRGYIASFQFRPPETYESDPFPDFPSVFNDLLPTEIPTKDGRGPLWLRTYQLGDPRDSHDDRFLPILELPESVEYIENLLMPDLLFELWDLNYTNTIIFNKMICPCQSDVDLFDEDFNNLIIDFVKCVLAQQRRR